MTTEISVPDVDIEELRCEIRSEYAEVAQNPDKGFHFHTGRDLAAIVGYALETLEGIPRLPSSRSQEPAIRSPWARSARAKGSSTSAAEPVSTA